MNKRQALSRTLAILALGGVALVASARKNSVFEPPITPTPTSLAEPPTPATSPTALSTEAPESTSTPEQARDVEIILTGDVLLGRTVMNESFELDDPRYPFLKIADTLTEADITFINLEGPIIDKCPVVPNDDRMVFCADPKMAEGLVYAGVDVVSLANNHTLDHGESGLAQTQEILQESGIEATGLGNLVVKEKEGIKFGFLGFDLFSIIQARKNRSLTEVEEETIKSLVMESKEKVDVLIVGVHWGQQYHKESEEFQRHWARNFIESGADVIVGNHPHVVQDMDHIDGKPVYYSLGNLVFDNMFEGFEETRRGLVMRLIYKEGKLIREEQLPTEIVSRAQPEFVKTDD